jgi:hypothetical protein
MNIRSYVFFYSFIKINRKWVIKSGTDFKSLSLIEVEKRYGEKNFFVSKIESYDIDAKLREDEDVALIVEDFKSKIILLKNFIFLLAS